jgi:hypothetical protein
LTVLLELKFSNIINSPFKDVSKMPIAPETYRLALCLIAYLLALLWPLFETSFEVQTKLVLGLAEPAMWLLAKGGDWDRVMMASEHVCLEDTSDLGRLYVFTIRTFLLPLFEVKQWSTTSTKFCCFWCWYCVLRLELCTSEE